MFTPAVEAAFVVIVAWLLALACQHFGIPLSEEGKPAGERASVALKEFAAKFK